ncbi:MAG: sugar ABC transporter permease, partial [Blautia sp.]|nr:sugar ABC transporter permease [Blautia sp.]
MNSKKKKMLKRAIPLYIMVAPGFIYLLINNYIPMLGIVIAFKNL